jgi:uncharacterized membrane protein SpoIIM required for sporulation
LTIHAKSIILQTKTEPPVREALFIKKNKDRWLRNQHMPSDNPDEMASDFTQLVEDLAYAKTFYPSGKVTGYLNKQASRIYLDIYHNRKEEGNRLWRFWKYDVPLTIAKHHRYLLFSFIFSLVFFSIGYFISGQDTQVARDFFGDGYVEETLDNIYSGNPFGIYEGGNPFMMFIYFMSHNYKIALIMFISGLFFGLPTLFFLAQNTVMLGIFDQFFAAHGYGTDFWMVVFVHGTLEMTGIVVAGAAGLVMGTSFLFPGTLTRMQAFRRGAKDGMKIMIGLMPVFAGAALFESTFTRLYQKYSYLTTGITIVSAIFVIWYFIIYPILLRRRLGIKREEI